MNTTTATAKKLASKRKDLHTTLLLRTHGLCVLCKMTLCNAMMMRSFFAVHILLRMSPTTTVNKLALNRLMFYRLIGRIEFVHLLFSIYVLEMYTFLLWKMKIFSRCYCCCCFLFFYFHFVSFISLQCPFHVEMLASFKWATVARRDFIAIDLFGFLHFGAIPHNICLHCVYSTRAHSLSSIGKSNFVSAGDALRCTSIRKLNLFR